MGLADANALRVIRSASRGVGVVRFAPVVWKRGRLHRADALLLFSGGDSRQHPVVLAAEYSWSLGDFWRCVHCNRGVAHTLCSARSCALELEKNFAARGFAGS